MAYTTVLYLNTMMPKNVSIGSVTVASPTIQQPQANTIATTTAQRYLNLATQHIDSRLRGIYICPLRKMKILEVNLTQTIAAGTDYLMVEDSGYFNLDSLVRVTDDVGSETYTVNKIFDDDRNKVGIGPVTTRIYSLANNPVVNVLEFPDPIPLICAQIAIGMMFDKIFSTQQPDLSNFGKAQRTQGTNAIDDILQGIIRLEGQDHTGRRFARSSLRDTISTTVEIQHSRDKEV